MKILLACDPTIPHEDLVQQVTARVWPAHAEFHVLSVIEEIPQAIIPETVSDLMLQATGHAEDKVELVAGCLKASGLTASPFVLEGNPHDVIVHEAASLNSDLILLGAPRLEEGYAFLSSRIARAVVRHAACSVQIVRTGVIRRVLVPTDGSESSLVAARVLASRKWSENTLFEVMSVVEPLSASIRFLYPPHNDSEEAEQMRANAMLHSQDAIKATEQILSAAGLAISDHVLVPIDSANKLILQEAAAWNADLIVLGSHGRRGIKRFLIGSVSESVAMHAACSVEVIR